MSVRRLLQLSLATVIALGCPSIALAETGTTLPGKASRKVRKKNPAFAKVVDDPALPRVLLIGDSISIGYTAPTRKLLEGKVNGTVTHTPEQYAANLEKLVQELKKTGAVLVFATTTPVPQGEGGRKVGDDSIYNAAAREVMQRNGITVNDLHAVMAGKMPDNAVGPGNVHFTPKGSQLLAEAVAQAVLEGLDEEE